jgi:hypothetical protein
MLVLLDKQFGMRVFESINVVLRMVFKTPSPVRPRLQRTRLTIAS